VKSDVRLVEVIIVALQIVRIWAWKGSAKPDLPAHLDHEVRWDLLEMQEQSARTDQKDQ
jgi:hypothetical protein